MKAIRPFFYLLLVSATTAHAQITRVQSKAANTAATNAATLACTLDATPTAGNHLVVVAGTNSSSATATRMTEQAGINWLAYYRGVSNVSQMIVIGRVTSGIASATVTETQIATAPIGMIVVEYSGVNFRFDKQAVASGSSTSPASGATETTSNANELWVGGISGRGNGAGAALSSPTNSFSIVAQTNTTNGSANADINVGFQNGS